MKISNSVGAQRPVFLPTIKLWQQYSKVTQKQKSNFFNLVQFYSISLLCSKDFVRDCSCIQFFIKAHLFEITFWRFSVTILFFQTLHKETRSKLPKDLVIIGTLAQSRLHLLSLQFYCKTIYQVSFINLTVCCVSFVLSRR